MKNWLSFWGQFKKINSDIDIDLEDKFHFHLKVTEPGSSDRTRASIFLEKTFIRQLNNKKIDLLDEMNY